MPGEPTDLIDGAALREVVIVFRDALRSHREALDRLNVYPVPDGDTGTNMARTLDAVVEELSDAGDELDAVCRAVGHGSLMGARGNSGVILSQILRAFCDRLAMAPTITPAAVADALAAASVGAYEAVLAPVEGTILTVCRHAAESAVGAAAAGGSLADVLRAARDRGRASLARTPELLPVLRDAGVVDAGGAGFLLLLDAALHVVAGDPVPDPPVVADTAVAPATGPADLGADGMRYEVMFLLELADRRVAGFKTRWGQLGTSVVVVGGGGTWNCHVHTNDIGGAIEAALRLGGRPSDIRITDLLDEVAAKRECAAARLVASAVVAVASGPGLASLFRERGAQVVMRPGETVNASTNELLAAVHDAPGDEVVVLPNDVDIVTVADQLGALTTRTVVVVPTRSMPEGLAALVRYDPAMTAESNGRVMAAAAGSVVSAEVSRAVSAGSAPAGEWIGLVVGGAAPAAGIVAGGPSIVGVATSLLAGLVTATSELVTIVAGEEADEADTAAIVDWVTTTWPAVQVDVHHGGQPLQPYLIGIE